MDERRTPEELRDGVRAGILASLRRDADLRGGRTARLLASAGLVGVVGALGAVLLVARHPFAHHAPWHLAVVSSVWAGLLVVSLSIVLLRVRTPSLPLAHAAAVGIVGLGLAGLCGACCPDQHFLHWWWSTAAGAGLTRHCGQGCCAFCFGAGTTAFFGLVSAFVVLGGKARPAMPPLMPTAMLLVLLLPGVALQSVGTSWEVFVGWLLGTGGGAYAGIASGIRLRALLIPPRSGDSDPPGVHPSPR